MLIKHGKGFKLYIILNQWSNETGGYETIQEFLTWKDFYVYCGECFADDIRSFWNSLESFERRGLDDEWHWLKELSVKDTMELFDDITGYELIIKEI